MKTLGKKKKKPLVSEPEKTMELPNPVKEQEQQSPIIEPAPSTQEFTAVQAETEKPLYELIRTSSGAYVKACKSLSWFDLHNTHLIVYSMFFIVLSVFAVYYGFFKTDKMLCAFSTVAALFMLYVIIWGPRLFANGMAFDEQRGEGTLVCLFYKDKLVIKSCGDNYTIAYTSIRSLRFIKHYAYIRLKSSKDFPNGIIMEKPADAEAVNVISELIKLSRETIQRAEL